MDTPLGNALTLFASNTVFITSESIDFPVKSWEGSGCLCGFAVNDKYPTKPVFLTAGHILDFDAEERVFWRVRRFYPDGTSRVCEFMTPSAVREGPGFLRFSDNRNDIGILTADHSCTDGDCFFDPGGHPPRPPVAVLAKDQRLLAGTRVGWCGFPREVHTRFKHPVLCYFEGVISAFVEEPHHPPVYLVDGHNAKGVSGGPLWHYSEERKKVELAAVIVRYAHSDDHFPGLVHATPIGTILQALARPGTLKML